mgnify:CR=1 FL=1
MVAAGVIDLESKIPGSKTYKPPQSLDIYNEDHSDNDEEVLPKETSMVENPMNEGTKQTQGASPTKPTLGISGKLDRSSLKGQQSSPSKSKFKQQNDQIQEIRDKLETDLVKYDYLPENEYNEANSPDGSPTKVSERLFPYNASPNEGLNFAVTPSRTPHGPSTISPLRPVLCA